MSKESAAALLEGLAWYGWAGLAVAAVFLTLGVGRVDDSARGAYAARIVLIPGVIVLWPVVLVRWAQLELRKRRSD